MRAAPSRHRWCCPLCFRRSPIRNGRFQIISSCRLPVLRYSGRMSDVTHILERTVQGDLKAADELLALVYEDLRRLAAHRMSNEVAGHTLQPTALVHEAWLRLVGNNGEAQFQNRAHFFAAAAEAMRRILIDRARRKRAAPPWRRPATCGYSGNGFGIARRR